MKRNYSSKKPSDNIKPKKKKYAYVIRIAFVIFCFIIVKYISSLSPDCRPKIKEFLTYSIDFSSVTAGVESFKNTILDITSN